MLQIIIQVLIISLGVKLVPFSHKKSQRVTIKNYSQKRNNIKNVLGKIEVSANISELEHIFSEIIPIHIKESINQRSFLL